jgi:hypothetical protein
MSSSSLTKKSLKPLPVGKDKTSSDFFGKASKVPSSPQEKVKTPVN